MSVQFAPLSVKVRVSLFFAAALAGGILTGCNSSLTPKITVASQNGGTSLLISGSGFTTTNAQCVNIIAAGATVTTTGTASAGSSTLTSVSSIAGIVAGQLIADTNGSIPAGAVVTAVNGSTITISTNATGSKTGDTFTIMTGLPGAQDFVSVAGTGVVSCSGGSWSYTWTPKVEACPASSPSAVLPVTVFAFDHPTLTPATANSTVACTPPPPPPPPMASCPGTLGVHTTSGMPNTLSNATMATYFSGGSTPSVGNLGPTQLSTGLNFSTCNADFSYKLTGSSQVSTGYVNGAAQSGSFTECSYKIGSVSNSPVAGCSKNSYTETLNFTCPNTTAGCGQ